jgi:hypothetical protein
MQQSERISSHLDRGQQQLLMLLPQEEEQEEELRRPARRMWTRLR